jgi:hypothetical protein
MQSSPPPRISDYTSDESRDLFDNDQGGLTDAKELPRRC